jgi:hypothetical protein
LGLPDTFKELLLMFASREMKDALAKFIDTLFLFGRVNSGDGTGMET